METGYQRFAFVAGCGDNDAMDLVVLGAGSMAVEVLDIVEAAGQDRVVAFVVDVEGAPGSLEGRPVYHVNALPMGPETCRLVAGIVSPARRRLVEAMAAKGYQFASVVHPSAQLSRRSSLGAGCVVHPGVIVASNSTVADHVLINRGALIGHDNHIESFATIGPGANVAGAVRVGTGAYLGVGCVVRDHLTIGAGAVVAAGAAVVKSVDAGALVAGVPARPLTGGGEGVRST